MERGAFRLASAFSAPEEATMVAAIVMITQGARYRENGMEPSLQQLRCYANRNNLELIVDDQENYHAFYNPSLLRGFSLFLFLCGCVPFGYSLCPLNNFYKQQSFLGYDMVKLPTSTCRSVRPVACRHKYSITF